MWTFFANITVDWSCSVCEIAAQSPIHSHTIYGIREKKQWKVIAAPHTQKKNSKIKSPKQAIDYMLINMMRQACGHWPIAYRSIDLIIILHVILDRNILTFYWFTHTFLVLLLLLQYIFFHALQWWIQSFPT